MKRMILIVCGLLFGWQVSMAQQTMKKWTLQDCLDYALENNIQLRQSRNDYLSGLEETKEAKAARLPLLSASVTQGFTNYPSGNAAERNSYTGNYGVNAGLTLYEGGRLRLGVQKSKMQNDIDRLLLDEAANDIRIAVVQAYMQALYAEEAVEIAQNTADVSKAELDRARVMHEVGTISRVDLAQLESQCASDSYQVAVSEATLNDCKLQLKQLLELDVMEEIELADVSFEQERILSLLPEKSSVYSRAMDSMPQIARSALDIKSAEIGVKESRAGFLPSVSLSASVGTGHISGNSGFAAGSQVWNRFNENVGLSVNIPIFSNRSNRTAVNKARIAVSNSRLARMDVEKELLKEVESAWNDAVSAQSQYRAALEKQYYAQQSYELTAEQFHVGAKNTVELITAQNEYASAQQEVLQAKYIALMNICLLDIYQGNEIK